MRGAEDIEGDDGMGQNLVPEDHLEVGVGAAHNCHKLVLPCADRAFGCVASMGSYGDKLELYNFLL